MLGYSNDRSLCYQCSGSSIEEMVRALQDNQVSEPHSPSHLISPLLFIPFHFLDFHLTVWLSLSLSMCVCVRVCVCVKVQYVLVRVAIAADSVKQTFTTRDVFIMWTGPNVGVVSAGKKKSHVGEVKKIIKVSCEEREERETCLMGVLLCWFLI